MRSSPPSPGAATAELGLRDAARGELARRAAGRARLLDFARATWPGYRGEPAHELIAATLDRVVAGEIARLMIFAPPQHGKSELASVRLPAYWLGRRPDDPVLIASYAASLAVSKSRQAREIVGSGEYARLFPGVATRSDSRASDDWALAGRRGSVRAVGIGGGITGRGGLLGIIDDPVEDYAAARSETIRESTWEWYRTTFRTRIWERGAIVLIMTRWHEDDLAGRLLRSQPGQWRVLRLPAVAETQEERDLRNVRMGLPAGEPEPLGRAPGEALAPLRFSRAALDDLRQSVGELAWFAQYQGAPAAAEGTTFQRPWFPIVEAAPAQARRVRYWDKAGTSGGGKRTAGVLMARAPDGVYYVEHVLTGQWSAAEREPVILQTARADAARLGNVVRVWVEQEPGSGGKESAESTIRTLAGFAVEADRVTGDKAVRAEPFAAQAKAGNVRLVSGAWNHAYLEEIVAFPNGAYSDQVDASSGAFNKLAPGRPFRPAAGGERPAVAGYAPR